MSDEAIAARVFGSDSTRTEAESAMGAVYDAADGAVQESKPRGLAASPLETSMVVFVHYCDVYKPSIAVCLESIRRQAYGDVHVIIVNDGSADTALIRDYIRDKPTFKMIHRETNGGPAASKWTFMEYLQTNRAMYTMNDIVCIIDGDDHLIGDSAFRVINETYHNHKCWVTYGDADGRFCDAHRTAIPDDWASDFVNVRTKPWIYNHPRTFKLGLAMMFIEEDFKKGDAWLTKGTDRPIVYSCIEMAGKDRVRYIDTVLYKYVDHENYSYKTVTCQERKAQLDYISKLEPKARIVEDIHIVMCYWKRPENLAIQLGNLNNQTVAKRIHLHLLNNNTQVASYLDETVETLKPTFPNIKVTLTHYENKWFGFQRFLYIRDNLVPHFFVDYAIMMDDDQTWADDWVERMYALRKPKTYTCWFGRKWTLDNTDYWDGSIVQPPELRQLKKLEIREFQYGGTGGSIVDVNIFSRNSKLWEIPTDLPKDTMIYNIEDLWLSFILRKVYEWTIPRAYLPDIGLIPESQWRKTAQSTSLRAPKRRLLVYLISKYGL
jgi:glycosyltransferase involved in cell wall biosynthesis